MNLGLAITHLFPNADPLKDFIIQDNGAEPVLREGAEEKGRVRYEIRQPDEGEEATEGIHYRYGIDYNLLTEGEDYDLVERGQYIAAWNIDAPQPTEEELQAAWEAFLEAEANKKPEPSAEEKIAALEAENVNLMLAMTKMYEENQKNSIDTMLAITELYELIVPVEK